MNSKESQGVLLYSFAKARPAQMIFITTSTIIIQRMMMLGNHILRMRNYGQAIGPRTGNETKNYGRSLHTKPKTRKATNLQNGDCTESKPIPTYSRVYT